MEDTIAAISTPAGEGGIGIVRISGERAGEILALLFDKKDAGAMRPRHLYYGHICDPEDGSVADEVLAVYMPGPATYTTEDVVEINCHGGMVPLKRVLSLVLKNGARLAEPGEFTKRAFLGGRLDLSQAEAVMDLVKARTDEGFDLAMKQLRGHLTKEIEGLRSILTDILVSLAVNIDYPDEDIEEIVYHKLIVDLKEAAKRANDLLEGAGRGKILREGVRAVIAGRPNVGKSSLLNGLLREERAIVTEIPGTTRDTIEEAVTIGGVQVVLTDTAGIRDTADPVERIGIERSHSSMEQADIRILIIDSSQPLGDEDLSLLKHMGGEKSLIIFNKADKPQEISDEEKESLSGGCRYISTCLREERDIRRVEQALEELVMEGTAPGRDSVLVSNIRHEEALRKGAEFLGSAVASALQGQPLELIEIDVSSAYEWLGYISGDSVQEDVINQVFSRFCLGK